MKKLYVYFCIVIFASCTINCSNKIINPVLEDVRKNNEEIINEIGSSSDSFHERSLHINCLQALKTIKENFKINNANKEFGFKLIEAIYSEKDNFSISPVSLSISLSVLAEGAQGETLDEIESFLTSGLVNGQEFINCMGNLSKVMNFNLDDEKLKLGNSLWIDKGFNVLTSYEDNIRTQFQSEIYRVNLWNKSSVKQINEWVSTATGGMINDILKEAPKCNLACLNAIYFSEKWYSAFSEKNTNNKKFTNSDGRQVHVPTMEAIRNLDVAETQYFTMIELPGRSSVLDIFIPKEGVNLSKNKEIEELKKIYNAKKKIYEVHFTLPKFQVYLKNDLKKYLQIMGLSNIFEASRADFSKICDKNISIGIIMQDNSISIDENGISASAFTIWDVMITESGKIPDFPKLDLKIDRPFYYCIHSKYADVIFFFGKVNQLSE